MKPLDSAPPMQLVTRRFRCCALGIWRSITRTETGKREASPLRKHAWTGARLLWRGARALLALVVADGAAAAPGPVATLCEDAAQAAAARTGVPVDVLRALALTETGRSLSGVLRPWPWALNVQGTGYWLDDRAAALAMARREVGRGVRNIDIGCFQINYRWHGEHFDSVSHMLDPAANGLYAAHFIASLYRETGSWAAAAGAYHSRTPVHARRYRQRFQRIYARLDSDGGAGATAARAPLDGGAGEHAPGRLATAGPFIGAGGAGRLGSLFAAPAAPGGPLVPIGAAARAGMQ